MKWFYQISLVAPTKKEAQVKGALLASLGPYAQCAVVKTGGKWVALATVYGQSVWDGQVKQVAGQAAYGQKTLINN